MAEGRSTFARLAIDQGRFQAHPIELQTHGIAIPTSYQVHASRQRHASSAHPGMVETVFLVPGQPGQTVPVTFTFVAPRARFRNEMGFFAVDDSSGRIGTRDPGDPGYAATAMASPSRQVLFGRGQAPGTVKTLDLPGGSAFGLYLVQNNTTEQLLARNPSLSSRRHPLAFVSFPTANSDHFAHLRQVAPNVFGFEDQSKGGDRDFNDLVFRIDFSTPHGGPPGDAQPPQVTIEQPRPGVLANHNLIVSGRVTDDSSGVATIQARFDAGAFFTVPFDATSGAFVFPTTLPLDHSSDGNHTVSLQATDRAGNRSNLASTSFILDTLAPAVTLGLDPASDAAPVGDSQTTLDHVRLLGQTEPSLNVALVGTNLTVQADAQGRFAFDGLTLALGSTTFTAQASDAAGNVGQISTTVTRTEPAPSGQDLPPRVTIAQPGGETVTNHNLVVSGQVGDDQGVSGLQASVFPSGGLAGTPFDVPFDPTTGSFRFTTNLKLDGSADGPYTVRLVARDTQGQPSTPSETTLILDATPPALTLGLDPASDTAPVGDGQTMTGQVRLLGQTEPNLNVHLVGTSLTAQADAQGHFTFDGVNLADGATTFTAQATDVAGNVGQTSTSVTFVPCPFDATLTGWTVGQTGGSASGQGNVTSQDCQAVLREGDSFNVTLTRTFIVPASDAQISFTYAGPAFDTTDPSSIKDAFEVALLDASGNPLVPTFVPGRDAFFNITEGLPAALGSATTVSGNHVVVNLSAIPAGTQARLVFRLVNNDNDHGTTVTIASADVPPAVTANPQAPGDQVPSTTAAILMQANPGPSFLPHSQSAASSLPSGMLTSSASSENPFATVVQLNFNSLPSAQGWVYFEGRGYPENDVFSVDGTTLHQNTLPVNDGSTNATYYALRDVIDPDLPFTIEVRARVLEQTGDPARHDGFGFGAYTGEQSIFVGIGPHDIGDSRLANFTILLTSAIDNTVFHDYRLEATPHAGSDLFVDDVLVGHLAPDPTGYPRQLILGDLGSGNNARAEVTFYRFSQQGLSTVNVSASVPDTQVPANSEVLLTGHASSVSNGLSGADTTLVQLGFDSLPSAQGWVYYNGGNGTPEADLYSADGTSLHQNTLQVNDSHGGPFGSANFYAYSINPIPDLPFTIEARARLLEESGSTTASRRHEGTGFSVLTGTEWFNFFLGTHDIMGGRLGNVDDEITDAIDNTVYHDYRLVCTPHVGGSLYVDGILVGQVVADPDLAASQVNIGDLGSANNGRADITFFRITQSAPAPATRAIAVTVNGVPVESLDAAGNFFTHVPVLAGLNGYTVTATDSAGQSATVSLAVQGVDPSSGQFDFSQFADVSASFGVDYARTSFGDATRTLYADSAVHNLGQYPANVPLLVGVRNISDPSVVPLDSAGITPDGTPYYDFSGLVTGGALNPGGRTGTLSLPFFDPKRAQFTYDLVFFGQLNQAPAFTTVPRTEAFVGHTYRYNAAATDPDNDPISFGLVTGSAGMTIDAHSGQVSWTPTGGDLGTHDVVVRVADGRGGSAEQHYTLTVSTPPPDRPPVITSTPVVEGHIGVAYVYPVMASDADDDPLHFTLTTAPAGMTIDAATGRITWPPTAADLDTHSVTVQVDDGQGGQASQTFTVCVDQAPGNDAPVIVSTPVINANPGQTYTPQLSRTENPNGAWSWGWKDIGQLTSTSLHPYDTPSTNSGVHGWFSSDAASGVANLGFNDTADAITVPEIGVYEAGAVALHPGNGGQSSVLRFVVPVSGWYAISAEFSSIDTGSTVGHVITKSGQIFAGAAHGSVVATFSTDRPVFLQIGDFVDFALDGQFLDGNTRLIAAVTRAADYRYDVDAVDADQDLLIYSLTQKPSGMTIDPQTGVITWTGALGPNHVTNGDFEQGDTGFGTELRNNIFPGSDGYYAINTDPFLVYGSLNPNVGSYGDHTTGGGKMMVVNGSTNPTAVNWEQTIAVEPGKTYEFFAWGSTTFDVAPAQLRFKINGETVGEPLALPSTEGDWQRFYTRWNSGIATSAKIQITNDQGAFIGNDFALDDIGFSEVLQSAPVTVRVDDGRGGFDTQSFTIDVSQGSGEISGTKFNDLNGNGVRDGVLFGTNLIVNGDAESGPASPAYPNVATPVPGWTVVGHFTAVQYAAAETRVYPFATDPGPPDRGDNFFSGGPSDASSSASQSIDVSPEAAAIDTGNVTFSLSGYLGGWNAERDQAVLTATFLGAAGNSLGSSTIGPVTPQDRNGVTGLFYRSTTDSLPEGTRAVSILLEMTRFDAISDDGYADDLSFVLDGPDEAGLPGWTIYLDQNHNGRRDSEEQSTTTDTQGNYDFTNLPPGTYAVAEVPQPGWRQTAPATGVHIVTLGSNELVAGQDFGNQQTGDTANHNPAIASTAPTTATTGQLFRYDVSASDPEGDSITFDLPAAPAGMTVQPTLGTLVWTPTPDQIGEYPVVIRVQDGNGGIVLQSFQVSVSAADTHPAITSNPPGPASVGLPYQYRVAAQDAEGDAIHFRLDDPAPQGMAIDTTSGLLTWTPTASQVGPNHVVVIAADSHGAESRQAFDLTVVATPANAPPVVVFHPPPSARQGLTYTAMVEATDANGDPLTFTLQPKPDGMTVDASGLISWTPTTAQLGTQHAHLVVSDGRPGGVVAEDFTIEVVVQAGNHAPIVTSTPRLTATVGRPYTLDLKGFDEDQDPLAWSLVTAPRGVSLDPRSGALRWTPDADQMGAQPVVVRVQDALGASSTQSFTVDVSCVNRAPAVTSTPPTTAAVGVGYFYAVRATDPEHDALTFTLLSSPRGNMNLDAATGLLRWTPAAADAGAPVPIAIQVDDGQGNLVTQRFAIVVSANPPNQPPLLTSTPVFQATLGKTYTYNVTARDPEDQPLTFALQAHPDGMTIDATGAIAWTPTTAQTGANVVTVVVRDPAGALATQSFTVQAQANLPPSISSKAPTTVAAGASYRYDVRATDPNGDPLTYALTSPPSGMTIDGLGRIRWAVPATLVPAGPVPVTVVVSDPQGLAATESFSITVQADTTAPRVQLTSSATLVDDQGRFVVDLNGQTQLHVQASDNIGVASLALTVDGVPVGLDGSGSATQVFAHPGTVHVVATATDAAGNVGTASADFRVRDPNDVNSPFVAITSPDQARTDNVATYLTDVVGSVHDDNLLAWHLDYALVSQVDLNSLAAPDPDWVELTRGTTNVENARLGTFDPTMLMNDQYVLRLFAEDTGGLISTRGVLVSVQGEAKLGNFHLEFTDLSVPLAGIPITVTRVYDTLQASHQGDFGFGWSLGLAQADIRETVPDNGSDFFSQSPFRDNTRVYLTGPDGKRIGFTFKPDLEGTFLFGVLARPHFVPDPGVYAQLDDPDVTDFALSRRSDGSYGGFLGLGNYNPSNYVLTMPDGVKYAYSQTASLQKVTDLNGNTLTFTAAGIFSSVGVNVLFDRDGQGRITKITDPDGHALKYTYNAAGDLIAFQDQAGNATKFSYKTTPAHYLDVVTDPLNRPVARVEYDAQGRLLATTDGVGNRSVQDFDPTHFTGTYTDGNGNVTQYVYDARGNIVSHTDPRANTTRFEFGDPANPDKVTKVTDPNGSETRYTYESRGNVARITDALGGVSTFEYNQLGEVTKLTDALGRVATKVYNANGNNTQIVDGAGTRSTIEYDSLGRPKSFIDNNGMATTYAYGDGSLPTRVIKPDGSIRALEYNRRGELSLLVNENGAQVSLDYDAVGRLETLIDPFGNVTSLKYDAASRLLSVTRPLNHATQYEYDTDGRLILETDPMGGETRYDYDANGALIATTDPLGRTTRNTYDSNGRLTAVVDPLGHTTRYAYDASGNRTAVIDANGHETMSVYDPLKRLVETIDPLGGTETFAYDGVGNMLKWTDKNDNATVYTYDMLNRLTSETNPLGGATSRSYDAAGNLLAVTDPLGHTTHDTYNSRNWLVETVDPAGGVTKYGYDHVGNRTSVTDQTGKKTTYAYDALDRVMSVVDPLGGVQSNTFDAAGNSITTSDPLGHATRYAYDALDRLISTTDPSSSTTLYTYDKVGNRTSLTDTLGRKTTFVYNAANQITEETDPAGNSTTRAYDSVGNMTGEVDRDGRKRTFAYDPADQRTSETWWSGSNITREIDFTYDLVGNRLSASDPDSHTASTYDAINRLSSVDNAGTPGGPHVILQYRYDAVGNITSVTDNLGVSVNSSYDSRNLLLQRTWNGMVIDPVRVDLSYNARGDRTTISRSSNTTGTSRVGSSIYNYAADGRLSRLQHLDAVDAVLAEYDFAYDPAGQLIHESDHGEDSSYTYDLTGQLTKVDRSSGPDESFSYDANGNPTGDATGALNEVLADGTFRYTYDPEGNLVKRTEIATGSTTQFTYDHRNRLVRAERRDASGTLQATVQFVYDVDDRRIEKLVDGQATYYSYDHSSTWADYNASRVVTARYLYGPAPDELLARYRPSDGTSWYLADNIGTVREIAGATGSVVDHLTFSSFGKLEGQTNPSAGDRFGFTGREFDPETGLYFFRARYYDATLGRFVSQDPLKFDAGDTNLYRYLNNGPIDATDPTGMTEAAETGEIISVGATAGFIASLSEAALEREIVLTTSEVLVNGLDGVVAISETVGTRIAVTSGLLAGVTKGILTTLGLLVLEFVPALVPSDLGEVDDTASDQLRTTFQADIGPNLHVVRQDRERKREKPFVMRFQVQWATGQGGPTFALPAEEFEDPGVTVAMAIAKLNATIAQVVPNAARVAAEPAAARQRKWIRKRPPAGIATVRYSRSEPFEYKRYTDARVDVENIVGHNLRE